MMDDDREEYRDPIPTPAELAAWPCPTAAAVQKLGEAS